MTLTESVTLNGSDLAPPVPLRVAIRPVGLDDMAYVRNSFAEGHKNAPGDCSMTWRYYKRYVVPELNAALAGSELLGAYRIDGVILGWLSICRGKRVDTVHWVHTRHSVGGELETYRRRGVMTALFDAARLGDRIAYTFRGAYPLHRSGVTMDERLMPWLAARGQHAAFVPWEEWNL